MNRQQRGAALLLVLWAMALLSLLLASLISEARQQASLGLWQREHLRAQLAAEAGLALAVRALNDPRPQARWRADGEPHPAQFEQAQLTVRVNSERGKLDVNAAPPDEVARLATALGASSDEAKGLAAALYRRRLGGHPLRTLEELRQLPGMGGLLYQRLVPHTTVWSGLSGPDPALATPVLREVFGLPRASALYADPGPVLSILSQARLPNGFTARFDATILLSSQDDTGQAYRLVHYSDQE